MRGGDDIRHLHHFRRREVRDILPDFSRLQRLLQCNVIHHFASGEIHQNYAVLHLVEGLAVDHAPGLIRQVEMDRQVIRFAVDGTVGFPDFHAAVQGQGVADAQIRVDSDNMHAQCIGGVGHHAAYGPQADDPQGLALQFCPCKFLFAFLHILGQIFILGIILHPADGIRNITGGVDHGTDHQFLHAVGIGSRGVENDDALFCAPLQRNIVDAGTGPDDGLQPVSEFHVMHFRTTDDDAVCFFGFIRFLVLIIQHCVDCIGDIIHTFILKHDMPPGSCSESDSTLPFYHSKLYVYRS